MKKLLLATGLLIVSSVAQATYSKSYDCTPTCVDSTKVTSSSMTTDQLAAGTTWDFVNGVKLSSSDYGNTGYMAANSEQNVTISAWSDTGYSSDIKLETAELGVNYWGLTVENQDNGDSHYIDNYNANDYDMVLLSFSSEVNLGGVNIGLYNSDSDISVAAFDSAPDFTNSSSNTWSEVASLATETWSFSNTGVAGYYEISTTAPDNSLVYAQYWLVGAYNSIFGTLTDCNEADAIKIAGIFTSSEPVTGGKPLPTPVPEPSSIALFAFALIGLVYRKKRAQ